MGDYIPAQRIASLPDAHISLKVCSKVYLLVNSVMPTSEEREAQDGFYGISGAVLNMTVVVHAQYLKSVHTIIVNFIAV